jgi:prophage regulatory protein
MAQQFLRLREVKALTGLSRSTIYQRIAAGRFPASVRLGSSHIVGWLAEEVELWIRDRVRESRGELAPVGPQ